MNAGILQISSYIYFTLISFPIGQAGLQVKTNILAVFSKQNLFPFLTSKNNINIEELKSKHQRKLNGIVIMQF